jgi:endonuclease/exonuclease/phosphatase family metal-dependent hydrolase
VNPPSPETGGGEGGCPHGGTAALVAVSFNLRHGLAWDRLHSWPLRKRAAAAAIDALHAEVVALQEVHGFQQRYLRRRLRGYAAVGAGRDDGRERGERCTVLYRPARLRLDSWTVRWLSDTPATPGSRTWGNPVTRIVTLCRFTDLNDGRRLGVADTHWDGASAASRLRSAEALLSWLEPDLPWIVLGDLNATADDPAVRALVAGGLADTMRHLGARGPGAGTHHSWDGARDGTRIDYVFVTPHWDILDARVEQARPTPGLPSDHWPVAATLRLARQTPVSG